MSDDNESLHSENTPVAQEKISEIDLRKQVDDNRFTYAMAALQAQERDREKIREHDRATQKSALKFFAGLGSLVLIITIAAFCLNKE